MLVSSRFAPTAPSFLLSNKLRACSSLFIFRFCSTKNWLEIYKPYEYWSAGAGVLPRLSNGQDFEPSSLELHRGTTEAPAAMSEVELITEMDKFKIGTDATIAQHIKTIQERQYVTKDAAQRFHPTKLGIALVEGYNSMGYQLNKPHLRADMERGCNDVARGAKQKQQVRKTMYLFLVLTCLLTRPTFYSLPTSSSTRH